VLIRAELKSAAKEQIKGNIGFLVLAMLVLIIIAAAAGAAVPVLGSLVVGVVTPAINIGFIYVFIRLTRGIKPRIEDLFNGMPIFGKAFLLSFLTQLFVFLWTLLLIVPGVIKSISWMFAPYILCENREMPVMDALKKSAEMTNGHKKDLFVLMLSFILWILLICVTFGIAAVYVAPYIQATMTNAYLKLKGDETSDGGLLDDVPQAN